MREVLSATTADQGLCEMAASIAGRHGRDTPLLLVGVRRGGIPIAERLRELLSQEYQRDVPIGTVDITLYRDDAATSLPNPKIGPTEIPTSNLEGQVVVLVDDVCFTGRTVRAAIDVLMDYGRPRKIELATLVDRPGRELPIQPDYTVTHVEVGNSERVDVLSDGLGLRAVVQPISAPSVPPPPP